MLERLNDRQGVVEVVASCAVARPRPGMPTRTGSTGPTSPRRALDHALTRVFTVCGTSIETPAPWTRTRLWDPNEVELRRTNRVVVWAPAAVVDLKVGACTELKGAIMFVSAASRATMLLVAAVGLSGCEGLGSTSDAEPADLHGTVTNADVSRLYCTVAVEWSDDKGVLAAMPQPVDREGNWSTTLSAGSTYSFEAFCSDPTREDSPVVSGISRRVHAPHTGAILIRVSKKSPDQFR